jgi:pSer/pThr/pTyr-binding forkhead associated (FHA) protein
LSLLLRILTGSLAGRAFTPSSDRFLAGRNADVDLRFDPDRDLSVSGRHAEFVRRGEQWLLRDLASRNGTLLNGQAITTEVPLAQGDRIEFGFDGPVAEVELGVPTLRESTTQRIRAGVQRELRRTRWLVSSLVLILFTLLAALLVADRYRRDAWVEERGQMQLRIDSLLASGAQSRSSLEGEVAGLQAALQESERRLRDLRSLLGHAQGGSADAESLQRQLVSATAALKRQQLAANLDYGLIQRRARGAVAMLWLEYVDGTRVTGTAFAVRTDGLLLTNRHLVSGEDGRRQVKRAAVRFSDSEQAFPARVIATSTHWDLAAVQLENVIGAVPAITEATFRVDSAGPGTPVAIIGFPYGGEPDPDPLRSRRVARPVVSAALVMRELNGELEIQGLGAAGASGSPILDRTGALVGILFGGRDDTGVQVLFAVPARAASAFLETLR